MVERPAAAFGESADEWTARGTAWSFVPGEVAGVVQFPEVGLPDQMFLSPMTCEAENEFLQAPNRAAQKCQTGTRAQTRTQRYTAVVRKNGRRVRVKRTRRIVVQVPSTTCATRTTGGSTPSRRLPTRRCTCSGSETRPLPSASRSSW